MVFWMGFRLWWKLTDSGLVGLVRVHRFNQHCVIVAVSKLVFVGDLTCSALGLVFEFAL